MTEGQKQRTQDKIYRQMLLIQESHWDTENERVPIKYFYRNAIKNARFSEDYEMCQAITDSAIKYGIDIDGKRVD